MKFKFFLTLCLAGASFGAFAQTHAEGAEYYRAEQYNNALELLEKNYNNPGTDKAIANYYLGLLSIKQKNMAQAKKYFEDGLAINPDYAYNYVGLGYLALQNNNLKEAETYFKKAEKLSKKDAAVFVAVARAYYEAKDGATVYAKQIEKALKDARKKNMLEPEIFIFEGDVAYDKGDINTAASNYDMAATYNPKAADAYVKYAKLYTKFNPSYSVSMLQRLLQNNPQSALGQRELANLYYDQQDFKNAVEQYGKYVNNPSHFKSDEDRYALLLFSAGEYKKGYDYATKLLKENPDNFTANRFQLFNAAYIPEMASELPAIANALYTKHASDPKKYPLGQLDYTLVADELIKQKRYDEAETFLREAIAEYPDNTDYYRTLAQVPLMKNDYKGATEGYKLYLSKTKDPSFGSYLQTAILALATAQTSTDAADRSKYLGEAITYAQKATEKNPEDYRAYKIMGDAKTLSAPTKQEQQTAGLADYQKALQLVSPEKNADDYNTLKKILGQ